jgi:kynurenine formamidase
MIRISLHINGRDWTMEPEALDIAIPLQFNGPQPNTYGVPPAASKAFEGSGFVGDVRRGGSCNFEEYRFVPHCNGTHTECVGHITADRIAVHEILNESFIPATLVSVFPERGDATADTYDPPLNPEDLVISRKSLAILADTDPAFLDALVIRTLPNDPDKKSRDYMQHPPAFFSLEAMALIRRKGVRHLLVDMPSVDRLFDEGKLRNHRIYWELPEGVSALDEEQAPLSTITEMVFVPDEVKDGHYVLELQIAAFMSDAAPGRPRLFRLRSRD